MAGVRVGNMVLKKSSGVRTTVQLYLIMCIPLHGIKHGHFLFIL